MKKLATLSPGSIFNFAGERFVVMEQRDGAAFVLLAQSKESCPFNDKDNVENRNDYTRSTLKERIDKWVEDLPRTSEEAAAILPFEVDLSCTDRSKSYGTITVKAAPLTLWQYGQFKELIPLNEDDWYWLVTPWACRWLRSPYTGDASYVWFVRSNGGYGNYNASNSFGIRPALILPSTLLVSDDGTVSTNTPPTITSTSGASGVNLGSKTAAFSFKYTPNDADGDKLTVTEKLDGVVKKTRTNVTSGTQLTFECASTAAEFQKILNGTHTITIEASDGKASATFTATFTKAVHKATITLKTPLAVSGDITAAVMSVVGQIPAGAVYKVEATNNAKDTSPVWQDVTAEVKSGANIVFTNKTAANGAAFNFRITVERGTSAGGYISGVSGAFQ